MLLDPAASGRAAVRTRLLAYGLLAYCATWVLFGPSVGELGLEAFGCPGRLGSAETGCQGLAILPAYALAPWLSVVPPVDTTFLLLQQSWLLIGAWLALIVLSMRSDRRQGLPGAVHPGSVQASETIAVASTLNASSAARQAQWIDQKQAEQEELHRVEQLSLQRRIIAEGALWGSLWIAFVLLVGGLAAFCLALGTPLIGGLNAEGLLRSFGCSDLSLMASNPWSGTCDFWTERLEPYRQPWVGALFSPIWLFTQFSDVLLIWMASILLVALLFVYRLGWALVFKHTPPVVKVGASIMFVAALAGLFYQGAIVTPPPVSSGGGGLGAGANVVELFFWVGAVVVAGLTVALITLIVLVIALFRHFKRARVAGEHQRRALDSNGNVP